MLSLTKLSLSLSEYVWYTTPLVLRPIHHTNRTQKPVITINMQTLGVCGSLSSSKRGWWKWKLFSNYSLFQFHWLFSHIYSAFCFFSSSFLLFYFWQYLVFFFNNNILLLVVLFLWFSYKILDIIVLYIIWFTKVCNMYGSLAGNNSLRS